MQELNKTIQDLRKHYANKPRKVTVRLVGKPYEKEHFQGKILVQDYRLSNSKRTFCEFIVL